VALASADPFGYYGYPAYRPYLLDGAPARHPGGGVSYTARSPQGLRGKREAEAEPSYSYQRVNRYDGYGPGLTSTYGVKTSGYGAYVDEPRIGYPRLAYGLRYKREAEAEPEAEAEAEASYYGGYYGSYGYPAYGYHGYGGRSFTYRSPQGLRGKREAEAEPAYSYQRVNRYDGPGLTSTYGVKTAGYSAYVDEPRLGYARAPAYGPYRYGLRYKREAEAEPAYSFQRVNRYDGYGRTSSYGVKTAGYNGYVNERRSVPYASFGYGFQAY